MGQLFDKLSSNPKRLFLIDTLGACLTILFLTAILIPLQNAFGMPLLVLEILVYVSVLLGLSSFSGFFFVKRKQSLFLKVIATLNILYCCLTTYFMVYYFEKLTVLGITYFLLEKVIILGLAYLEMRAAYKFSEDQKIAA